jgi:hypothetical protein
MGRKLLTPLYAGDSGENPSGWVLSVNKLPHSAPSMSYSFSTRGGFSSIFVKKASYFYYNGIFRKLANEVC